MNRTQKIGMSIVTVVPLLTVSLFSSGEVFGIFSCTANDRGVGEVSVSSKTKDSVSLFWNASDYQYTGVHVCYKKAWSLSGKCQDDDRIVTKNYGGYVTNGDVSIYGLDKKSCYKFAVYGTVPGPEVPKQLIGQVKTVTEKK